MDPRPGFALQLQPVIFTLDRRIKGIPGKVPVEGVGGLLLGRHPCHVITFRAWRFRRRPATGARRRPQARSGSPRPAAGRRHPTAVSNSTSASLCADPRCSIARQPRRNEYTIWTAVAPGNVFTVRTYADTPTHYGPKLPASAQISAQIRTNSRIKTPQRTELHDRDKSRPTEAVA